MTGDLVTGEPAGGDLVVVGAGIVGASVAFHAARAGAASPSSTPGGRAAA